jgi:Helicase HerA, central domain
LAEPLTVLRGIQLHYTLLTDAVWSDDLGHVDRLNARAASHFERLFSSADHSAGPSPIGLVLAGASGTGKTHLLGAFRRFVARRALFVSVPMVDAGRFWESVALAYARSLLRPEGNRTQLQGVLEALGSALGWHDEVKAAVVAGDVVPRAIRDEILRGFRVQHPVVGREAHDALRALLLYGSADPEQQDLGDAWLQAVDLGDEHRSEGFRRPYSARETVAMVSALVSLVRPQVVAFDQLDIFVAGVDLKTDSAAVHALEVLCAALMDLRDVTRRSVTILSCLLATWTAMQEIALPAFPDRFERSDLRDIQSGSEAREVVAARLSAVYRVAGFGPPYPTWPVKPSAFDGEAVQRFSTRGILKRVEDHIHECVQRGVVAELEAFQQPVTEDLPKVDVSVLGETDELFAEIRRTAAIEQLLAPDQEDARVPALLRAALAALVKELGPVGERMSLDDDLAVKRTALHAVLRLGDGESERQRVWSFRALGHANARAVIARLGAAATAAGIEGGAEGRVLVLLRNAPWPPGPRTAELVHKLERLAFRTLPFEEDDLRTFVALQTLLVKPPERFLEWLRSRRPVSTSGLFRRLLEWTPIREGSPARPSDLPVVPTLSLVNPQPDTADAALKVVRSSDDRYLPLPLGILAKHTVVFAGSGSGKTVLLRRIVEEAALHGVSSIVLDSNNDLARLGDPWPSPPPGWVDGDPQRAAEYHANIEVVVWTPRISAGRPLAFQPLADFGAMRDDPDLLERAIDGAVASLAPRALVEGQAQKAVLGRAVLKLALRRFADQGVGSFDGFRALLADLPADTAPEIERAQTLAASMAQNLAAARVNDPLFGGAGEPADPGRLLTPTAGKRARVSVISFIGLEEGTARQSFVDQLQMSLFTWVKRHPAEGRPLGWLYVMDEAQNFAPSEGTTPCTYSTLLLVSQARKYGLGMLFATQAPKGLNNKVPGNSTTQFYGKLNAPVQVQTAREMAAAKGGEVDAISHLSVGEFYACSDGFPLQRARAGVCYSWHPPTALTEAQVLERARRST